jgi:YVTN family beta-propeller protein
VKPRRLVWIAAGTVLLIIVLTAAFSYRYLILSKLNIADGENETTLGLRKLAEVPLTGSANRFDYLSIDPKDGQLFIAHMGSHQVVVFDTKLAKVTATLPDTADVHGVLAVPENGRLYATSAGTHQVVVMDLKTYQVLARVDAESYPDGMAYDPENQKLFVSDESGGRVIVIDTRTNQRINQIDLGGQVGNTLYDAGGHQILSAAQGRNQLALIDPMREQITSPIDLTGCIGPHGFTIDSPSRTAFVSCEGNAKLFVVNIDTKQITASDQVGDIPDVLAFDPGLQRLYVASESGVVAVFQVHNQTLEKIGQTYLAPNAHTLAVDPQSHLVYVPLENIDGNPLLRIYEPLKK